MVPVGELPRHMMMHAERYLTGKVVPGSRIIATGIYSTFAPSGKGVSFSYSRFLVLVRRGIVSLRKQKNTSGAPALRTPYLRVLGIELDTSLSTSPGSRAFSPEEEEEFQQLSRSEGLYERFSKSVAPSIFGNDGQSLLLLLPGPLFPYLLSLSELATYLYARVKLTSRYQKSSHMSPIRRLQKTLTGRSKITWRYKRPITR